jgi:hypothetical protein
LVFFFDFRFVTTHASNRIIFVFVEAKIIESDLMYSEVDLDDMTENNDGSFVYDCRCGNQFSIDEQQLENGLDIVQCHGCTLCIKVLYDIQDENDDDQ